MKMLDVRCKHLEHVWDYYKGENVTNNLVLQN